MDEKIKIKIDNKIHEYYKGITLDEVKEDFKEKFKFPIIVAKLDKKLVELSTILKKDCEVEFFDFNSCLGNRVYERGVIFLFILSIKQLYGKDKDISVEHSIGRGICIKTNFHITEKTLDRIKKQILDNIDKNLAIDKLVIDKKEAIKYFARIGYKSQEKALAYTNNSYVRMYRLGNLFDFFYSTMPIDTHSLTKFTLTYINSTTLILRIPCIYLDGKIAQHSNCDKLFTTFNNHKEWIKKLNINSAADLNAISAEGKIRDIVKIDEIFQNNKLLEIAEVINNKKEELKIVLMAGPSSSGKTTTSRKLAMCLRGFGLNPISISIDDYFKERAETPKDKDGNYEYESISAIDVNLFNKQVAQLLAGDEVLTPTYNFITGMKEYKNKLKMKKNDILIVEGLHALNNSLTETIPKSKKIRIYLSPLTSLNIDSHNRISTSDNRLIRRIVRDNRTRGYSVEETLATWPLVRKGEEQYIFKYAEDNDIIFNTALVYEIGVLKTYIEPLLYSVDSNSDYYEEASRLLSLLESFLSISADGVPEDSILREFIGGSCFEK